MPASVAVSAERIKLGRAWPMCLARACPALPARVILVVLLASLRMNPVQWVWMMVACQLALFALGWLGAVRMASESRMVLRGLALFNLMVASGVMLVALRGQLGYVLTHAGASLFIVIGFVVLWRSSEMLFAARPSDREQLAVTVLACAGVIGFGLSADTSQARVTTLFVAMAVVVCRGSWQAYRALCRDGERGVARVVLSIGWLVGAMLVLRTTVAWLGDVPLELNHAAAASQALAFGFAVAAYAINLVFAYVVVGRVVLRLQRLSRHDVLTGLLNRGAIVDSAEQEWDRFMRTGQTFSVAFLDIDHFKSINDGFGHAAGDAVLSSVSTVLRESLRRGDVVGRSGGEEFLVVLVGADRTTALDAAERLRREVAQSAACRPAPDHPVTVSMGVAVANAGVSSLDDLVARADAALYRAKALGRNRVGMDPPDKLTGQTPFAAPRPARA